MTTKKHIFSSNILGKEKYMEEPEQIIMNNNNLRMDSEEDEELVIPAKHVALQKLIDDYSENSSIENGSLCELNCIPFYNVGDKHFQSYSQRLQYYTTIGKDECPRIFDINQYYHDSYSSNLSSPLRQRSFSVINNDYSSYSVVSNTTTPTSITTPIIPLNNSLNIDNNESYYSDTSVETNTVINNNLTSGDMSYFIKTYNSEDETNNIKPTIIPSSSNSSSILFATPNNESKLLKSKTFNLMNKTIPLKFLPKINEIKDSVKFPNRNDIDFNESIKDNNSEDIPNISQSSKSFNNSKQKLNNDVIVENAIDIDRNNNKEKQEEQKINKEEQTVKKEKQKQKLIISTIPESKSKKEEEIEKTETKTKDKTKEKDIKKEKEKEKEKEKSSINDTSSTSSNKVISKKHRSSVSKYDFVKVLVYLSGEHYYVLSRFLISRMLTATKVDYYHAVRIALDLKKRLVDCNELELTQKKLEKTLFNLMKEYGYNEEYTSLYKLISGFYRERIPMIILISGPRCVGKSTLATKLAERLNLPNIVKTDTVYDLMCSIFNVSEEDREPIWYKNCSTDELLEKYEKDCKLVKRGKV